MAGGGSKPGERRGGRKKGTPNRITAERWAKYAAGGEMPIDYMLRIMRDATKDKSIRSDMAKAAAPYLHPRLASYQIGGDDESPIQMIQQIRRVIVDKYGKDVSSA